MKKLLILSVLALFDYYTVNAKANHESCVTYASIVMELDEAQNGCYEDGSEYSAQWSGHYNACMN